MKCERPSVEYWFNPVKPPKGVTWKNWPGARKAKAETISSTLTRAMRLTSEFVAEHSERGDDAEKSYRYGDPSRIPLFAVLADKAPDPQGAKTPRGADAALLVCDHRYYPCRGAECIIVGTIVAKMN